MAYCRPQNRHAWSTLMGMATSVSKPHDDAVAASCLVWSSAFWPESCACCCPSWLIDFTNTILRKHFILDNGLWSFEDKKRWASCDQQVLGICWGCLELICSFCCETSACTQSQLDQWCLLYATFNETLLVLMWLYWFVIVSCGKWPCFDDTPLFFGNIFVEAMYVWHMMWRKSHLWGEQVWVSHLTGACFTLQVGLCEHLDAEWIMLAGVFCTACFECAQHIEWLPWHLTGLTFRQCGSALFDLLPVVAG